LDDQHRIVMKTPTQHNKWASLDLGDQTIFPLVVLLCLLSLVARRPDAFTMPWFYAEEGRDFLAQAYAQGWSSLLGTANGYFHVLPRSVALIGLSAGLPIAAIPWLNLGVLLITYTLVWYYIWHLFPGGAWARATAILIATLVPTGHEIWMNMTNVQWPLALILVLMLSRSEHSPVLGPMIDACVVLLAAFTGPFAVVLSPLALWRLWRERKALRTGDLRQVMVPLLVILVAVITLVPLIAHGTVDRTSGTLDPLDPGFVQVVFYQLWFPILGMWIHDVPLGWQVLLALLGLSATLWAWLRTRRASTFPGALLAAAVLLFVAVLIGYRGAPGFLSPYYAGIRNFHLPAVLVVWAWSAMAARWTSGHYWPMVSLLLWWVLLLVQVGPKRFRSRPEKFDTVVLEQGVPVEVPIDPPGWVMELERQP
jgi:hypothetical protein